LGRLLRLQQEDQQTTALLLDQMRDYGLLTAESLQRINNKLDELNEKVATKEDVAGLSRQIAGLQPVFTPPLDYPPVDPDLHAAYLELKGKLEEAFSLADLGELCMKLGLDPESVRPRHQAAR